MTAGSGIRHQEMPLGNARGQMRGFHLWANLPRALKMTAPRYQDVKGRAMPEILEDDGTVTQVNVGEFRGEKGPVDRIAAEPQYRDIFVPEGRRKTFKVDTRRNAFAYAIEALEIFATRAARKAFFRKRRSGATRSTFATCRATAR